MEEEIYYEFLLLTDTDQKIFNVVLTKYDIFADFVLTLTDIDQRGEQLEKSDPNYQEFRKAFLKIADQVLDLELIKRMNIEAVIYTISDEEKEALKNGLQTGKLP